MKERTTGSEWALCKSMIEQVYADLLAVGEIVESAFGDEVARQLFAAVEVLNDADGELARVFKIRPEVGRIPVDIQGERARRQRLAG